MRATAAVLAAAILSACASGTDGAPGVQGPPGPPGLAYFTAPGLSLEISSAGVAPDGSATATIHVADEEGTPLDLAGLLTQGSTTLRFAIASLGETAPGEAGHYRAHTTRAGAGGGAPQPAPDTGGDLAEVAGEPGTYVYTFGQRVAPLDPARTHTIAAWGWRELDGTRYAATAVHEFVPAGGAVAIRREAVLQARCDACHGALSKHDGAARDVRACLVCHTPEATDEDTGNSLELGALVHAIHRGRELPSVVAGVPYRTIDEDGAAHDFSTVWYPRDLRRCTSCHAGAQADLWRTRPSRAACTSCHDRTAFVDPPPPGMTLHADGPQADDSCGTCHGEAGSAPVAPAHEEAPPLTPTGRLELIVDAVSQTAPGQEPLVTFRVKVDGAPRDIMASPLSYIRVNLAGPTTDYARSWQVTAHGSGASGTLEAVDATNGVFRYQLPASAAMPLEATGSYAVALYGRFQQGSTIHLARNEPFFVSVTDPAPVPRRVVVDEAACDACHGELIGHNAYRGVQHCLFCHDAENAGDERIARFEGTTVTAPSVHLKVLVHEIHRGAALVKQPYLVGSSPLPSESNPQGNQLEFGTVRYPRDLRDCRACHLPGTYDLPLAPGALPSREEVLTCTESAIEDTDFLCEDRTVAPVYTPPETAACTSCHDAPWTAAHAAVNTAPGGAESCATCHGAGSAWGVDRVHAISP